MATQTIVLIIALVLRLPLLNQSLWLDEAIEALALMGHYGPLHQYALIDFQPPLYHYLLAGWTSLAGFSEIALRIPSLVAGIVSIGVLMKLVEALSNKKTALVAGLLLATNPLHIYYSQEGRTYMLTTLFVSASFYYLVLLLKKNKRKYSILYTAYCILSLWSSYLAWITIALQLAYLLYKKRFEIVIWNVISWLTLIAWIPSLLKQLQIGFANIKLSPQWGEVVGGFEWQRVPRTWIKFILGRISIPNRVWYATISLAAIVLHMWYLLRTPLEKATFFLLWLTTVPLAIAISLVVPVYQYFRVLFALPAYISLIAWGLTQRKMWQRGLVLLIVLNLTSLMYFWTTPSFHRENWRALVADIDHEAPPGSAVAMPSLEQNPPLVYYGLDLPTFEPKNNPPKQFERIYYIDYAEDLFDPDVRGRANLEGAGYVVKEERTYPGLHVLVYEMPFKPAVW